MFAPFVLYKSFVGTFTETAKLAPDQLNTFTLSADRTCIIDSIILASCYGASLMTRLVYFGAQDTVSSAPRSGHAIYGPERETRHQVEVLPSGVLYVGAGTTFRVETLDDVNIFVSYREINDCAVT